MRQKHVMAGTSISRAIRGAIDEAEIYGDSVQFEFNGVGLIAQPDTDPDLLEAFWRSAMNRSATYRESPEGKRQAEKSAQRLVDDQTLADALMAEFGTIDFGNLPALVDWMDRLTEPSDHVGVFIPVPYIITAFHEHGYEPNVNTGDDFAVEDRDNFGRYLIGQGLSCLASVGAIHSIFRKMAGEWRERFGIAA